MTPSRSPRLALILWISVVWGSQPSHADPPRARAHETTPTTRIDRVIAFQPALDGPLRACPYLRVSTGRQAEGDLSIPDQRRAIDAFCQARGWPIVAEHVEPGDSATDDSRAAFQAMIERAIDGDRPYDVIVVRSFSRFFRDAFGLEMYVRRLAKAGGASSRSPRNSATTPRR